MSDLITRTARLVPYLKRPKHAPSYATAYSYEPLPDEAGASLGSLYVAIEVLVSGRASEEVADLIIETAGQHYFNLRTPEANPLHQFEAAVKAVNQELSEHVNRGNAAWIGKLSAIIAIQAGPELHVAQTGSAEAFLYRGKSSTRISNGALTRPTTPNKTFGSIASGQLEVGDRLLITTPALVHQIQLSRLQSLISQSGPNAAIAEITHLLNGTSIDRIASLVIEITTPELAALQVRSEEPDEITLSAPETPLEVVKQAAVPIAQSTLVSTKKAADIAHTKWKRAQPKAKTAGLFIADYLRRNLSDKRSRKIIIGIVIILVVILTTISTILIQKSAQSASLKYFDSQYNRYLQAQSALDSGNNASARQTLLSVQSNLKQLDESRQHRIESAAIKRPGTAGPKSVTALLGLVDKDIDQLDGLTQVSPITVYRFPKGATAGFFELSSGRGYAFDKAGVLTVINLAAGTAQSSKAQTAQLGTIVSTTLSYNADGIYVLTAEPSVWFYRFDTDSLTRQTVSFGTWPKAKAIASYASNLYLLGDDAIYKHTKNATGFSPRTTYVSDQTHLAKATGLAVDGSVYVSSPAGISVYASGSLKDTVAPPNGLPSLGRLSVRDDVLTGASAGTKRLGLWDLSGDGPVFKHQIALSGLSGSVISGIFDRSSGSVYGLSADQLVRFPATPYVAK